MKLEELQVYQLSMTIAERIWDIVIGWDYFAKDFVGKQLMKAADSVAANLSEGFAGIFTKRINNFVIILEDHYSRQRPGLEKPRTEN